MDKQLLKEIITRYESASFTVNRMINVMVRELLPENLTAEQLEVLRYIRERGMCTSSELADYFLVGKSSITAIVTRLADKSWIQRHPDEKDRRVTYLALTSAGKQLVAENQELVENLLARYMLHFSDTEAKSFIETFEKFARLLVQEEGGRTTS